MQSPAQRKDQMDLSDDDEAAAAQKAVARNGVGDGNPLFDQSAFLKLAFTLNQLGEKMRNPKVRALRYLMQLVQKFPHYLRDISDFQYDRRIGKGGFGEVWLGNDLRTGKIVAIKELYADQLVGRHLGNFCREVNTMCKIHSRFVVRIVGFTIEPPFSIITEYMPNGSLFYYTNKTQRKFQLSGTHMSIIAMCLAHGMSSVRAAHVIHRDLKAANVLLDENRLPVLCDFGIARIEMGQTRMTPKVGTYSHMAPEVMVGGDYGYDCDKYSYGMILYEMVEGRNPFGNVKPATELLRMVPAGAEPPMREPNTPRPLIDLIRLLWDRDPAKRPSWEDIFYMWANGKVYFEGTDKQVVREFSESLVDSLKKNKLPVELVDFKVSDAVMALQRLSRKLHQAVANCDEHGVEIHSEQSESEERRYDDGEKDLSNVAGGQTELANNSEGILRDPSNPNFDRALDYFTDVLAPKQFLVLYSSVMDHFRDPDANESALRKCLSAFTRMATKDPDFFNYMARAHFFTSLPLATNRLIDASMEFVALLVEKRPQLVDQSLKRALSSFMLKRPVDAAHIFAMYISKYDELTDPHPIIDLYISYARAFLNNAGGAIIVDSLIFLLDHDAEFKTARLDMIRPVFSAYCRSKCIATVKAALIGLIHILDDQVKVPFDAVCRNIGSRELFNPSLALLLRVSKYPVSRTLCRVLVERALAHPRAFEALWKFAAQEDDTAALVAKNLKWMTSTSPDAFNLFLIVAMHHDLREAMVKSSLFGTFMARMAATEDKKIMIAIPSVLKRVPLNQEVIDALTEGTFFKRYYASVRKLQDVSVMSACNSLLDHMSRIGITQDFTIYLPMLVKMLNMRNELTTGAICVLASLSCHSYMAEKFQIPEVISYFKSIQQVPSLAKMANALLSNVERAAAKQK